MQLSHCTLTGVDESTDLSRLAGLSSEFPFAEWGFLYSPTRQGQPGRYPSVSTILRAFRELPAHVRLALHVCGQGVPDLLGSEPTVTDLVRAVGARGGRIQLNFNQQRDRLDLVRMGEWLALRDGLTVITQHNAANDVVHQAFLAHGNHAVLFDASGGQGLSPERWPAPLPGTSCGYAGGMGPDNLRQELGRIAAAAAGHVTWIDMEGKLRTPGPTGAPDWFDTTRCEACLRAVNGWAAGDPAAAPTSQGRLSR